MLGYDDEKNNNGSNNNKLLFSANSQRNAIEETETTQINEKHISLVEDKDIFFCQRQHQMTPYDNKNHRIAEEQQEKQNIGKEFSKLEKFASFMIALLGLSMYGLPFLYDILK